MRPFSHPEIGRTYNETDLELKKSNGYSNHCGGHKARYFNSREFLRFAEGNLIPILGTKADVPNRY